MSIRNDQIAENTMFETQKAVSHLIGVLSRDDSFYRTWHAHIAMAFYDQHRNAMSKLNPLSQELLTDDRIDMLDISTLAAHNFLYTLGVRSECFRPQ